MVQTRGKKASEKTEEKTTPIEDLKPKKNGKNNVQTDVVVEQKQENGKRGGRAKAKAEEKDKSKQLKDEQVAAQNALDSAATTSTNRIDTDNKNVTNSDQTQSSGKRKASKSPVKTDDSKPLKKKTKIDDSLDNSAPKEIVKKEPAKPNAKDIGTTDDGSGSNIVTAIFKGGAAVDPNCPIKDKVHVYMQGNMIYDATLNQSNVKNNNNKFYIIQLLQSDTDPNQFYIWNRWGRIGSPGQHALKQFQNDLQGAIGDYETKFHDKTVSGNYIKLDITYENEKEEEEKKNKESDDKNKSALHKSVKELIQLIFDLNMMNKQMKEIGYDAKKMPLGKLSQANIQKGYEVLERLTKALDAKKSRSFLEDLSSEFYSLIPHDFGYQKMQNFTLDTKEKVKLKIEMLDSIRDIQIATKLIEDNTGSENVLDANYTKLNCDLQPLDHTSDEFKILETYVKNTHATTHNTFSLEILDIFKTTREPEQNRYTKHIHNKMLLWHGSRLTNWVGILSQGLRIAPPEAPVTGYMFGKGVYFADMVSKSANYCFTTRENNIGCLLLCEVALGNCNELYYADYNAQNLPPGKHSTKGCGKTAPSGSITIDGDVIVPSGKGESTDIRQSSLLYNEYIVYDIAQVKMRYLFKMKFNYKH